MRSGRGNGEEFALFLDNLKQLSAYMKDTILSEPDNEEIRKNLAEKLKNLKKHRRKTKKMEDNSDVDSFHEVTQTIIRTVKFSLLGGLEIDLAKELETVVDSFDKVKRIYGMKNRDKVKSVELAREIEENCESIEDECYKMMKGSMEDDFSREMIQKILDICDELKFLSDDFITSVDSEIK